MLPAATEPISEVGVDALELAIGFGLVPLVDGGSGGSGGTGTASLLRRVSMVRRQIATELGIVIPRVRIHDELGMESHEYVIKIRGSEVTRGRIMPGHLLAMNPGDALGSLSGIPTREPAFGLEAVWVHESGRAEAESLGYTVVDPESVIVTHLTETIRGHAAELLSRQDVRALLDRLKETNAAVVDEVVPEMLSLGRDPARAAIAACRGRADPRPGHDRGGDRRQGSNNTGHEPSFGVRSPGAGPGDHGSPPGRAVASASDNP